ncbi:MAG: tetratricopeptide repeat protein, partial [Candidatus Latescibacteria bacterium]|nr:tetratricopeptide repeat protein [Candidatus Latescibacterota bacterium]
LARSAVSAASAAVGLGLLAASKAFVDYSTSGLENPLVHLGLFLFTRVYLAGGPMALRGLAVIAGLCICTRLDMGLLLAPALVAAACAAPWRRVLRWTCAGFAPLGLWTAFSLFYYGSPVPNTAYAKLNTGIARGELFDQGLAYYLNSLGADPLTLGVIACSLSLVLRYRQGRALALGMILYMGYVVWIGGDFMSGRFFSGVFAIAVALIVRFDFDALRPGAAAAVVLALAHLAFANSPLRASVDYGGGDLKDEHEIADERGYYYASTGLFANDRRPLADHKLAQEGRRAAVAGKSPVLAGNIGFFGFYAGPGVYVLDGFALADPLLARLPIRSMHWRVGHYVRDIPDGYWETLATGRVELEDPRLNQFYRALTMIARGPLWSPERWREIWRLNAGAYDELLAPFFVARELQVEGFDLLAQGKAAKALPVFAQAVALDSTRAAAWYGLAHARRLGGDYPGAITAVRRALARESYRVMYQEELAELAVAFDERGEAVMARTLYEEVLSHNAQIPVVHLRLGRLYELDGRRAEAIDQYRVFLKAHPDDDRVAAHLRALEGR